MLDIASVLACRISCIFVVIFAIVLRAYDAIQGITFATREKRIALPTGKIQQGCSLPQLRQRMPVSP
jgi:hypothetical protein